MQDRVPLYPGRVKLTPVAGQDNVYDMVRADQPTQEGTPLNKNSLLKDATAALFQLGADAVPDDVFNVLSRAVFFGENGELSDALGNKKGIRMTFGQYTGSGSSSRTIKADFNIQFAVIVRDSEASNAPENLAFLPSFVCAVGGSEKKPIFTQASQEFSTDDVLTKPTENSIKMYYTLSSKSRIMNVSGVVYQYMLLGY